MKQKVSPVVVAVVVVVLLGVFGFLIWHGTSGGGNAEETEKKIKATMAGAGSNPSGAYTGKGVPPGGTGAVNQGGVPPTLR